MVFRDSLCSFFGGFGVGRALSGAAQMVGVVPELLLQPAVPQSLDVLQALRPQQPQPSQEHHQGLPGWPGLLCSVSHLSLTPGHAESKGRTWQPGKLSLPILLLQIRAQLHPCSCVSLVCAAGAPPQVALGRRELFMKDLPPRGSFSALKSTQLSCALYPSASPSSAKSPFLSRLRTSEGHLSTPSSVIPLPPVSPACPCAAAIQGSTLGRGTWGPQGFLQLLPLLGTFFVPCLGLHSGAEAPALWQGITAPSQPCRPCQATSGTWGPPDWSGYCQHDPGAASGTWVPLVSPECFQCDPGAAQVPPG